jgi:nucleoside-diphosphate-sugar epimerase
LNAKRILVTGGTGFIGRHCLAGLSARGYEVHATSSQPQSAQTGIHWHQINLLDGARTTALIAEVRPAGLLHLAWYAKHGLFWDALENLDWARASLALLRAFIDHGGRRMVGAGTCAEYDWCDRHCIESSTPLVPQSLYGVSKNAFRSIAAEAARRSGISFAWGRIFYLYGPGEQASRLVPLIVRSQLRREKIVCSGSDLLRDYLYVADVASALVALFDSPLEGAVNIGSGNAISVGSIADKIAGRLGAPQLVEFKTRGRADNTAPLIVADTTRLSGELGWRPAVGLEDGIDQTIEWWRRHADVNT